MITALFCHGEEIRLNVPDGGLERKRGLSATPIAAHLDNQQDDKRTLGSGGDVSWDGLGYTVDSLHLCPGGDSETP